MARIKPFMTEITDRLQGARFRLLNRLCVPSYCSEEEREPLKPAQRMKIATMVRREAALLIEMADRYETEEHDHG